MNDGHHPYTTEQSESAQQLIHELKQAIPSLRWLTTHYWISPGRKNDPLGYPVYKLASSVQLEIWKPN